MKVVKIFKMSQSLVAAQHSDNISMVTPYKDVDPATVGHNKKMFNTEQQTYSSILPSFYYHIIALCRACEHRATEVHTILKKHLSSYAFNPIPDTTAVDTCRGYQRAICLKRIADGKGETRQW